MLHETWKTRTPLKKVKVVHTDAKKFTVSDMLTVGETHMMSLTKLKNTIKLLITQVTLAVITKLILKKYKYFLRYSDLEFKKAGVSRYSRLFSCT